MRVSLLIVCFAMITGVCSSQPLINSSPKKIKILSWNIYMLPGFLSMSKAKRATAIGNMLSRSDYDVIVFQEAFCPIARRRIGRELDSAFNYQAGPANRKWFSLKTNSGIWMVSRYPVISYQSITFKNKFGADAFSRKGAVLVELDMNGNRIQVVGTHLQNAGPSWIKQAQCVELFERLMKPNRHEGVPQIVCGDFNISRHSNEDGYKFMLTSLDASDGPLDGVNRFTYNRVENDLHVEKGTSNDLIDYVLIRENGAWVQCSSRKVRVIRKKWDKHHQDLSDHFSMEAEIFFTNSPPQLSQLVMP